MALNHRNGESGAGEPESRGIPPGCRCEALRSLAEQSEAIPIGLASTIIPINGLEICYHEDHEEHEEI